MKVIIAGSRDITDYKLITEVEALSKELAKLKEEVTALKEMHGDQALLIHSLKKENESSNK